MTRIAGLEGPQSEARSSSRGTSSFGCTQTTIIALFKASISHYSVSRFSLHSHYARPYQRPQTPHSCHPLSVDGDGSLLWPTSSTPTPAFGCEEACFSLSLESCPSPCCPP